MMPELAIDEIAVKIRLAAMSSLRRMRVVRRLSLRASLGVRDSLTKSKDVRASAPPPDDYARSIVSAGGSDVSVPLNTLRTAHGTQKTE